MTARGAVGLHGKGMPILSPRQDIVTAQAGDPPGPGKPGIEEELFSQRHLLGRGGIVGWLRHAVRKGIGAQGAGENEAEQGEKGFHGRSFKRASVDRTSANSPWRLARET